MLGFDTTFGATRTDRFGPGDPDSPIWLDDVQCSGSETNILQCERNDFGSHNCRHSEDVGLICADRSKIFI